MASILPDISRTFSEYLLIPGYSSCECTPANVSLKTALVKHKKGEDPAVTMNIPMTSAIMQAVSSPALACALAQQGGISFLSANQSIEQQALMIREVKGHKAGVVTSDANLSPDMTLANVLELKKQTGHTTMPVTQAGTAHGKLLGIVTSRDYRISRDDPSKKVADFMTPLTSLVTAPATISLSEANDIIWDKKINQLPLVDDAGRLVGLVFRKDYDFHKSHPLENLDADKRYVVGAGINTHDYLERVPVMVEQGADVLCIDSSEGYSEWQKNTLSWIKKTYGESVKVGAGNVVDGEGFRFLVDAGADFVKVGIGAGSICITRNQKGIGRGQASALIDVVAERNRYYEETGIYVPVCSDGGIVYDYHITIALALGADFVMLGRYFARFDEAPSEKVVINGIPMKDYWGEGSSRAQNFARYELGENKRALSFVEGVDSYVPYAGSLEENVQSTLLKVRSTMCNCGARSLAEFAEKAKLTLVSSTSLVEGDAHDVLLRESASKDEARS